MSHEQIYHAFRNENWSAVKLPAWTDNPNTTKAIKTLCKGIARKKCWHLINFSNHNYYSPHMSRGVVFRYRAHALEFLRKWMAVRVAQHNRHTTGYEEGSKEAFQQSLREKWGSYCITRLKRKFYFVDPYTDPEMQSWFKENSITDYAFDSKEQVWYFAQHKDAVLFKMIWNE